MDQVINVFCSVSTKEIDKVQSWLIPSLAAQRRISGVMLHLVNYTGEGRIYDGPGHIGKVSISEISKGSQCGFGEAHNFAFQTVSPEKCFLIVNPDVYCHESCISELLKTLESNSDAGLVEARQLPFEHPKEYDEATGHTPWASGSCVLADSAFFRQVNGFDENFWMYCEDVDLSWQAWLNKYTVIHCRDAVAYHYTGAHYQYRNDRFYIEQFWCARNFIYLMYKYWGEKGESKAIRMLSDTWYPQQFKDAAIDSYERLKSGLPGRSPLLDMSSRVLPASRIKVVGFNMYHTERKAG